MRSVAKFISVFMLLTASACSAPLLGGEVKTPDVGSGAAPSHIGHWEPAVSAAVERADRDVTVRDRAPAATGGFARARDAQCWQCR